MWNYYGNNGVSIVFNSQKLLTFFHEIRDKYAESGFLNLCRGDVMYGDSADDLILLHPQALEITHVGDEETLLLNSKHLILQHVSLIKSRAWEYEQEYRIGYPLETPLMKIMQDNNDLGFTNTLKDSIIKPQIILNNFPLDTIDKIIISPFNKNNLTKPSIEELFKIHGISNVEVINSDIAVR